MYLSPCGPTFKLPDPLSRRIRRPMLRVRHLSPTTCSRASHASVLAVSELSHVGLEATLP